MDYNLSLPDETGEREPDLVIRLSSLPPLYTPVAERSERACAGEVDPLYDDARECESSSPVTDSFQPLFSVEEARALVRRRDELLREYEAVNRRVLGLAAFLPDHMKEQVFGTSSISGPVFLQGDALSHPSNPPAPPAPPAVMEAPQPTMQDVIVNMLNEKLDVCSQDQIEQFIWSIPRFADRRISSPEVIARALERASRNGRLRKKGLNYYSINVPLRADGLAPTSVSIIGATVIGAIERLLRGVDESLEPWEIIDKLKSDPEVGDKVKGRPQGVYAALSRLAGRRIIYRDVDGYRIGAK